MRLQLPFSHLLFTIVVLLVSSFAQLGWSISVTGDDSFLRKSAGEWTEAQALHVLNDSPWAHTVTTAVQDEQCTYEHAAFPGLFPEDEAPLMDLRSPIVPATKVKPDGAEYVVRLLSVKPMQAAVERLLTLDEKWAPYRQGWGADTQIQPTNLAEGYYNPRDEITIAVILKRPGPDGASFYDYAFIDKRIFPKPGFQVFACSAVKTPDGQTTAVLATMRGWHDGPTGIALSFPRVVNGKALIARPNEELQFRMIANRHVFETTFVVSPSDLLDGSEGLIHIPATVDEPTPDSES